MIIVEFMKSKISSLAPYNQLKSGCKTYAALCSKLQNPLESN